MPPTHPQLTPLQLSILRVLWERGEAPVPEVRSALSGERALAHNTIATVLTRLEKQGLVTHRTEGRQYVYRALIVESEAKASMVEELTDRVFEGDLALHFAQLLGRADVAPGDLDRIKQMIENRERELGDKEHAE